MDPAIRPGLSVGHGPILRDLTVFIGCLLYTSDAADE